MPELPEVETVVRSLRSTLIGLCIRNAELLFSSILRNEDPGNFALLRGARIQAIERAGKYIVFQLERKGEPLQLIAHLGMTGRLLVEPRRNPHVKHTHAVLDLSDGRQLRYVDPRRFGRLLVNVPQASGRTPLPAVASGREPLEIDEHEFVELFRNRKAPIKSTLLNQKLLRGMGNIYADEALFRAGIHPLGQSVSISRLKRLRRAIVEVLTEAIAAGGSSISDYVDSNGQQGWFQFRHRVYGRERQPCVNCGTPIRRVVIGGRSAHYCPRCQRRQTRRTQGITAAA